MISRYKKGYVYILFNKRNGTLYTGVTSNLPKRIYEHKNKLAKGFTSKYGVDKLGYYEVFEGINEAIAREKQIKSGSREKKIALIEKVNPEWIIERLLPVADKRSEIICEQGSMPSGSAGRRPL